ncbi:MAG: hypothetical protein IKC03_01285 [Oscillospiraceae bacterium]|nr:hypothetical protein [Oscillospiraceae bacterium]
MNHLKYGNLPKLTKPKVEYRHFYNSEEAEKWGYAVYADWATKYKQTIQLAKKLSPKITNLSLNALEFYCGYSHQHFNSYMRGNNPISDLYKEASDILVFTIASAPPIPEDIVVYRVACDNFIHELVEKSTDNSAAIEAGFLSTSLLKDISKEPEHYADNHNLLKIFVPKGTPGVYVNTVCSRNEYEMLFAPNCFLQLVEQPYNDPILQKTIYECELFI